MYERMLNKELVPSIDDISQMIGNEGSVYLRKLQEFLCDSYDLSVELRFPFGNSYGWGYKYSHKSKHLCYAFFEKGAFTVMIQIGKNELDKLYGKLDSLSSKTKDSWEHRYPCGDGGWILHRVLCEEDLNDIKELVMIKKGPIKK